MSNIKLVKLTIEKMYGPCPVGDFLQANAWAESIDWEEVQETVEADYPDFAWAPSHDKDMTAAEAEVFEARHEMMRHAGHDAK